MCSTSAHVRLELWVRVQKHGLVVMEMRHCEREACLAGQRASSEARGLVDCHTYLVVQYVALMFERSENVTIVYT